MLDLFNRVNKFENTNNVRKVLEGTELSDEQLDQHKTNNNLTSFEKLYVDVNVANFGIKRIIVYEGDTVESLVADFVKRCPIDEFMVEKLKLLL